MRKYVDIKEECVKQLPKLLKTQVGWLWISDFWDGPLSGMVKYNESWYWCFCFCENDIEENEEENKSQNTWFRRFLIVELTSEQIEDEKYWNDLFCEHVRTDTTSYEARKDKNIKPTNNHKLFYEPYSKRVKPDYSKNKAVGWIEY